MSEEIFGGFFYINAFGPINQGDDEKFYSFLTRSAPPPRTSVYINSSGGDVEAAIEIGRMIRSGWFSTSVGQYLLDHRSPSPFIISRNLSSGCCMSAATLLYLGGRLRHFPSGTRFGVHQFSFKNPSPENIGRSQLLSAKIARYVADMGIKPDFLEVSASVPDDSLELLDKPRLQSLGVVTGGQTDATWTVQARGRMLYVRGERDSLFGHHKVMFCYSKEVGFLFWAVIESQGRENELMRNKLVEIVVNGEDTRIDISGRCERMVNGIYVNILSKITQEEAEIVAYSDSFGVQVRFSKEAEMFLGVAAMDTDGGKEQLQVLYESLGGQQ